MLNKADQLARFHRQQNSAYMHHAHRSLQPFPTTVRSNTTAFLPTLANCQIKKLDLIKEERDRLFPLAARRTPEWHSSFFSGWVLLRIKKHFRREREKERITHDKKLVKPWDWSAILQGRLEKYVQNVAADIADEKVQSSH